LKHYEVVVDKDAADEAMDATAFIAQSSPLNAIRWLERLQRAIESLQSMPNRCGYARENDLLGEKLRQYIYKSYRIIFQVDEAAGIVRILHVRHAARRAIGEMEEE
jgi:plasmid stabilization system protein ParE